MFTGQGRSTRKQRWWWLVGKVGVGLLSPSLSLSLFLQLLQLVVSVIVAAILAIWIIRIFQVLSVNNSGQNTGNFMQTRACLNIVVAWSEGSNPYRATSKGI